MMDITRNQFFLFGLVALFVGLELRFVEGFQLKNSVTQAALKGSNPPLASVNAAAQTATGAEQPPITKVITPDDWIGWALTSVGSVLILHALMMKAPGG